MGTKGTKGVLKVVGTLVSLVRAREAVVRKGGRKEGKKKREERRGKEKERRDTRWRRWGGGEEREGRGEGRGEKGGKEGIETDIAPQDSEHAGDDEHNTSKRSRNIDGPIVAE